MKKKNKNAAKTAKMAAKAKSESLRFQTFWKAKTRYPQMDAQTEERLNQELAWIDNCGFTNGFLQLNEAMEIITTNLNTEVGNSKGFLAGSAVAYCFGLCADDPMMADLVPDEMLQPEKPYMLNVEIRLDPEIRNQAVALVEEKFGKSMMRNYIPIIKLDHIILEFQRDMTRMK